MRIGDMKNDVDLIRAILVEVKGRVTLDPRAVEVAGYEPLLVARHVERLIEDGLLDGQVYPPLLGLSAPEADVRDLTTAGHNFLASLESQDVWAQLKAALKPGEIAALPVRRLAAIAGDLAERAIHKKLGLD